MLSERDHRSFPRRAAGCRAALVSLLVASGTLAGGPLAGAEPAAAYGVDTSALMGSPDALPPLEIEPAFPALSFTRPVAIANAGDGSDRLFVCDQPGIVWVFPNHEDVREARVFLDLRDRVRGDHFEEGLLGLAFHPKFEDNGELFVYYSTAPRASVVSRFRVAADDPGRADAAGEERILVVPQPFGNHNSGCLEFGPDGMLYISLGDGGAANDPHGNGQNLSTLLGSILRIDVDRKDPGLAYAVPPDNPFVGRAGARGEIWAYGLRNPWRISFDRLTGDLWAGDVGQDQWEEIDRIVKGGNYGWNAREGTHPFPPGAAAGDADADAAGFVEPIFEYARSEGKSITGGVVYRGQRLPELAGAYLYADFVTFNVWALRHDGKKAASNHLIARGWLPVAAFGEDEAGEVTLAAFESRPGRDIQKLDAGQVFQLDQGRLYRLRRRRGPDADTADFPRLLSQTGLFADLATLAPVRGALSYSVNVPLWSDGADKHRFLALPPGAKIGFSPSGHWELPVGAVLVKTFTLDRGDGGDHWLETRLLVRSERGWDGYTYLWDADRADARLLDAALTRSYAVRRNGVVEEQSWTFPSRSDCNACHTGVAGHVLGLNTRQLNRDHPVDGVGIHQIERFDRLGVFTAPLETPVERLESYPRWGDANAPRETLARAYLDVNCAICHTPGGTGIARADLRFHTPLEATFTVGQVPGQARVGAADSLVIAPGEPQRSELLSRLLRQGQGRMPTLATSRVDWEAVRVIGEWIEGMGRRDDGGGR